MRSRKNKICLLLLQFFSTERVYLTYRKSIKFVFLAKEENDRISPGFQLPLLWERSVGKFCYIFLAHFCLGVSYQWRKRLHFLPSCGLRFSKVHGQVRFCGFLSTLLIAILTSNIAKRRSRRPHQYLKIGINPVTKYCMEKSTIQQTCLKKSGCPNKI